MPPRAIPSRPPGPRRADRIAANYYNELTGFALTGSTSLDPNQDYLTDVGAYSSSPGPYGTFDENGDAAQWTDVSAGGTRAYALGGDWYFGGDFSLSSNGVTEIVADSPVSYMGFRVVSVGVPEPSGHHAPARLCRLPVGLRLGMAMRTTAFLPGPAAEDAGV